MPTTRAASTPSRRAMRKAESKKQSFSVPCLRSCRGIRRGGPCPYICDPVRAKAEAAPKMGPTEGHPLVATHSQLEILVYTPRPPGSSLQVLTALVRPLTVEYAST